MPPAAQQAMPTQPNPAMMAALRARVLAGRLGQPAGPAPNSMNAGIPQATPAPASPMPPQSVNTPGGGTPTQQVMKTAAQAQSPLMDDQTRAVAKTLIQKLMQHM